MFYKEWYKKDVKSVGDLLDADNAFLDFKTFIGKFDINSVNYVHYYSLKSAIPKQWKDKLKIDKGSVLRNP